MRISLWLFCIAVPLAAQNGTATKSKAEDYPAQAKLQRAALGAEYMVHSFSARNQTFAASDYLVVEAAVFPERGHELMVAASHFTLRVNGKKQVLFPQPAGFVAASLKYPDWQQRPTLTAGAGLGDAGVMIGRPSPVERFPGDPRPRQTRLPAPPRAPGGEDRSGVEREDVPKAEEIAVDAALPEGPQRGPVSGYLYFAFKGKTKSIKSLELVYSGPEGNASLPLL